MRGRVREHLMKGHNDLVKRSRRKKTHIYTHKDSLRPLVPLSYWLRAHPVLAATDDITV